MKLTLIERHLEVGDVVTFIFKPEEPLSWQAGQYLHYVLPHPDADDRGEERWFTIASAPFEGHVQITTRISEKRSSFKDHLNSLNIGDTIEADGPEGDFVVHDPSREMLLIAGGIGITPYRAMLLDMDNKGERINATLLYANRDENIAFKDELEALKARHPHFSIQYFIGDQRLDEAGIRTSVPNLIHPHTNPPYEKNTNVGMPSKVNLPPHQSQDWCGGLPKIGVGASPLFYISGPEPMVKSFAEVLERMGVPKENIKLDDFPGYDWP